jgi:phenylacetic acid degradation operon negative regulatory protein
MLPRGAPLWQGAAVPEWKPLSARSTVLSLVLGAHPEGLSARQLTRAALGLGVSAATTRVALTRAVAAADLRRADGAYHLGARLLERGRRQEEHAAELPWDGSWEMAVVVGVGGPGGERLARRAALAARRLAEQREGVWLRPANLGPRPPAPADRAVQTFRATPDGDPVVLAASLWDLSGWAAATGAAVDALAGTPEPATRLAVAAHLVRHLATDPLLPAELCPPGWPADAARAVYRDYQREVLAQVHGAG